MATLRGLAYRVRRQWSLLVNPPSVAGGSDQWLRLVMNDEVGQALEALAPGSEAIEISGTDHAGRGWARYDTIAWPEHDICAPTLDVEHRYDVVVAEQVLEHVVDPWQAVRNMASLAKPGGLVVVTTPFLLRVHDVPKDYWRFTKDGLSVLLEGAGLNVESVHSWGNRACVRGNLDQWARRRWWQSLRDEAPYPVVVWAYARRPLG